MYLNLVEAEVGVMQMNVSQLLQEVVGASRDYEVSDEVDIAGDGNFREVRGKVRLLRTHRGILVRAELNTEIELTCSRCLRSFRSPVTLKNRRRVHFGCRYRQRYSVTHPGRTRCFRR